MERAIMSPGLLFDYDPREPPPPHLQFLHDGLVMPSPFQNLAALDQLHCRPHLQARQPIHLAKIAREVPQPGAEPAESSPPPPRAAFLPPTSTYIKVDIVEDMAAITVKHEFDNNSNSKITQGTYQFPLPHTCTVVDLKCRIGTDTVLTGVVKPKAQAKSEFSNAIRKRRSAVLFEQETPEIFRASIGNVPPQTKCCVELSFILLLKHDFSPTASSARTTLTLPTYIAPRYGTPPVEISQPASRGARTTLSVQVDILAAAEITSVSSDTHQIQVDRGVGQRRCQTWAEFLQPPEINKRRSARVGLSGGAAFLDKDLILTFCTQHAARSEAPTALLETHPSLENHGALMVSIPPKFMLETVRPNDDGEIIFLADRSGSMSDKIDGLKSALQFFVRGISKTRSFNIWCFGTLYKSLWPTSRPYSQQTMTEALDFVSEDFASDMGGTELLGALMAMVAVRDKAKALDVVVLTDGEVWRLDETLNFVTQSRRESGSLLRFFALGIGDAVSHSLINGIAKAGGGYAEIIPPANQSGWEDRMVAVLGAALTGHCGEVSVEMADYSAKDRNSAQPPSIQASPLNTSAINPFARARIFFLLEGALTTPCTTVRIRTQDCTGALVSVDIPVLQLRDKDLKLHRFAARSLLEDLERGRSWAHNRPRNYDEYIDDPLIQREGERLGCKWSIVSKWTSLVAIRSEKPKLVPSKELITAQEELQTQIGDCDDLGLLRPRAITYQQSYYHSDSTSPRSLQPGSNPAALPVFDQVCPTSGGYSSSGSFDSPPSSYSFEFSSTGMVPRSDYMLWSSAESNEEHMPFCMFGDVEEALTFDTYPAQDFPPLASPPPPPPPPASRRHRYSRKLGENSIAPSVAQNPTVQSGHDSGDLPCKVTSVNTPKFCLMSVSVDSFVDQPISVSAKTSDARTKAFVLAIVGFQQANGCFQFPSEYNAHRSLGSKLFTIMNQVQVLGVSQPVAVTAVLVAFLETHVRNWEDLWTLSMKKARNFLSTSQTEDEDAEEANRVLDNAMVMVAQIKLEDINLDDAGKPELSESEPVELQYAPVLNA